MFRSWQAFVTGLAFCLLTGLIMAADTIPRSEHPRPDFRRDRWVCLNGTWQFRFDPEDQGLREKWQTTDGHFGRQIVVPFCWQSKLSGIAETSEQRIGWYRRTISIPAAWKEDRVWLCFGAVDYEARVWVNGQEVGSHQGGYTPFAFDITDRASPGNEAVVVVRAFDATDPELPLGKQVAGWYTPTSGIWQTVWLEARPKAHLDHCRLTPRYRGQQWSVEVDLVVTGPDGSVKVEIGSGDTDVLKHEATVEVRQGQGILLATLDVDSAKPWTPQDPHLYDLEIRVTAPGGGVDTVQTYFGLRTIKRGGYGDLPHEVILLNGEPIFLRGALDQSFNPDGIYTAPSDDFMRRDMEIAKQAGLNVLRLHVKSEEPRRLYWADRTGMLIMQDMPCTFQQSPRARRAWEATMRATIHRDYNHPALIAWCLFNESWGLGDEAYKTDRDTQDWVSEMWREVKQELDPSRLVEDNSPNRRDHVRTDLNSWHFYVNDYRRARAHIENVVANTKHGSPFNYVPGKAQNGAPLISSEYGAVAARGGDRDISWGFRFLTTQLRRHELLTGYVYTGLYDVEWERNGLVNYDRSNKEFGYDAFVGGMKLADLQGADFVGYDTPPVLEVGPGEEFAVPIFVSHYSRRTIAPTLQWKITGVDNLGQPVVTEAQTQPVVWSPYRVTYQKPLQIRSPSERPLVGALALELLDEQGDRIAANFVNLIVRQLPPSDMDGQPDVEAGQGPRVEVLGQRLVAVRFDPAEFASFRTDELGLDWLDDSGKFYATGTCEVEYHLALPQFVRDAFPAKIVLMAELATKADTQRLDWPAVRRPLDYPQTQERKYAGKASVRLFEQELWQIDLQDDPADARGVLSHYARYHHGSYGYLVRKKFDLTNHVPIREALYTKPFFPLVFRTVDGHGLSIYGQRMGRYPIDPTIIIQTARNLSRPAGWTSTQRVTVHRLLDKSRLVHGIRSGDDGGHAWRYATQRPDDDWTDPAWDDSSWQTGTGAFGKDAVELGRTRTAWTSAEIWLRTEMEMPEKPVGATLQYLHNGDIEIYVNGELLLRSTGSVQDYQELALSKEQKDRFRQGSNTLAVHCRRQGEAGTVDLGVRWIDIETDIDE